MLTLIGAGEQPVIRGRTRSQPGKYTDMAIRCAEEG